MSLIKLHYQGVERYFNTDKVSVIQRHYDDSHTLIYMAGDDSPFGADETPEEILLALPYSERLFEWKR